MHHRQVGGQDLRFFFNKIYKWYNISRGNKVGNDEDFKRRIESEPEDDADIYAHIKSWREIPKYSFHDDIYGFKDLLYRLSHSIQVPYEQMIEVEFDQQTLQVDESVGFPLWKIRCACYHYGQKVTTDRVWLRDAVLDAIIQTKPKKRGGKKELEDHFEICNLEIAHSKTKPRSEYIKRRREQIKKQKENGKSR